VSDLAPYSRRRRDYYARCSRGSPSCCACWPSSRPSGDRMSTHGNTLLDLTRQPRGTVAITCTAHGVFVAWCNPPAPTNLVGGPMTCAGTPSPADAAAATDAEGP
jgi:hypothetical protein